MAFEGREEGVGRNRKSVEPFAMTTAGRRGIRTGGAEQDEEPPYLQWDVFKTEIPFGRINRLPSNN